MVAYAIDLASGINIKGIPFIQHTTIKLYLAAAASFAIDKLLPDPRYRHNMFGFQVGKNMFPELHHWLSFLKKWEGPTNKAWSLDMNILQQLKTTLQTSNPLSHTASAIDAIVLGAYTGARCSEYCRGTFRKGELFAKVPDNKFTREWRGYPIAFVNSDITFLNSSRCIIHTSRANQEAQYVQIRFRFDKGGGQNFSVRTFRTLPSEPFLCPVLTALRILTRWSRICKDERFPICCFHDKRKTAVLTDTQVTTTLREAVKSAYPNPNHVFRQQIQLFRTHSIRVFACCTLVAAGLTTEQIEYKLRWCSTSWKGYIRESLSEVDLISMKIFSSGLTDATPQHGMTITTPTPS